MLSENQFKALDAWVSATAKAATEPTPENVKTAATLRHDAHRLLTRCCEGGPHWGHAEDCKEPRAFA